MLYWILGVNIRGRYTEISLYWASNGQYLQSNQHIEQMSSTQMSCHIRGFKMVVQTVALISPHKMLPSYWYGLSVDIYMSVSGTIDLFVNSHSQGIIHITLNSMRTISLDWMVVINIVFLVQSVLYWTHYMLFVGNCWLFSGRQIDYIL